MHMTEEREHHQMHRHQFTLNIIHIYKQSAIVLFWMHIICFSKLTFKIKDKLDCFIVGNRGQIRHRLSSTQKTMYLSVVCTYLITELLQRSILRINTQWHITFIYRYHQPVMSFFLKSFCMIKRAYETASFFS